MVRVNEHGSTYVTTQRSGASGVFLIRSGFIMTQVKLMCILESHNHKNSMEKYKDEGNS